MIKTLMGIGCRVHWDGSVWYLSIYSRELVETLKPRLTDPLNDKEWLKGFVDAEGSIYEWVHKNNKTYYQISITNTNLRYIENVKRVLKGVGIEYRITITKDKWRPRYRVLINKIESIKRFLVEIGFRHPLKAEKANYVLRLYL